MSGIELGLNFPFCMLFRVCIRFVPSPNKAFYFLGKYFLFCRYSKKSLFFSVIILENNLDSPLEGGLLEFASCYFRW